MNDIGLKQYQVTKPEGNYSFIYDFGEVSNKTSYLFPLCIVVEGLPCDSINFILKMDVKNIILACIKNPSNEHQNMYYLQSK